MLFLNTLLIISTTENLTFKIKNSRVVEKIFHEKMSRDL